MCALNIPRFGKNSYNVDRILHVTAEWPANSNQMVDIKIKKFNKKMKREKQLIHT